MRMSDVNLFDDYFKYDGKGKYEPSDIGKRHAKLKNALELIKDVSDRCPGCDSHTIASMALEEDDER